MRQIVPYELVPTLDRRVVWELALVASQIMASLEPRLPAELWWLVVDHVVALEAQC